MTIKKIRSPFRGSRQKPHSSVRKFYFLEYFAILLQSVEKYSREDEVFASFKILKQKHRLGESKYKRLTDDGETLTQKQQQRYQYTFRQVVEESKIYQLVRENSEGDALELTAQGKKFLNMLDKETGISEKFRYALLERMERDSGVFRQLVEFLFKNNPTRSGVLVLPHYSPRELRFERAEMKTTKDVRAYCEKLTRRLEKDILSHLNKSLSLAEENEEILGKLVDDGLLPTERDTAFRPHDYNKIIKRIRDFWITYFLQSLFECPFSMSTFEILVYRAKQIGIIHVTESYPFTNGKVVYPTSVIANTVASNDFKNVFEYNDGYGLYLHTPDFDAFRESFVAELVKGYFTIRRVNRNYFINLIALREIVCYALKISSMTFEKLLNEVYRLNILGGLKIRIALEVDRLPEETNAMYLKREPVLVDGTYKNIIAIDVTKGEKVE